MNDYPPLGMESLMPFGKHKGTKVRVLLFGELAYMQHMIEERKAFELDNHAFAEYQRLIDA